MPFSEKIKKEVREIAEFRCCRCQNIGIDVHHIIPEEKCGPNTINNAAPLCPNCHDWFGDNPKKRKEITEMRDWWYKKVKENADRGCLSNKQLEHLNMLVESAKESKQAFGDLKKMLNLVNSKIVSSITPSNAASIATGIVSTSSSISLISCSRSSGGASSSSSKSSSSRNPGGTGPSAKNSP